MRNGLSENRIVAKQEEPSRRTDLSDHSSDHMSRTVTSTTRSLGLHKIVWTHKIPQTYKIGLLSNGYRTVKVIADPSDLQDRTVIYQLSDS